MIRPEPETRRIIMNKTALTAAPGKKEIVISRIFDAPSELIFKTYLDPALIPHWWGPRRLVTTVERMDVRQGGQWRFTQRDTDGSVYAFHGEYREIVPSERLVSTFEFEGEPGHVVVETAIFEALPGNQTRLTVTSVFGTVEDRDGMLSSGMEGGAMETWERLEELLAQRQNPSRQ
jgi:uncharacterized protein YndB with AHSA1/START domain